VTNKLKKKSCKSLWCVIIVCGIIESGRMVPHIWYYEFVLSLTEESPHCHFH